MSIAPIAPGERDPVRLVAVIRQLIQGRNDATGVVTLAHDGIKTATIVLAPNCGVGSAVFLFPQTAHAAAAVPTTFVPPGFSAGPPALGVISRQFTIVHAATAFADVTFWWVCLG
jgi:hypothetical protein